MYAALEDPTVYGAQEDAINKAMDLAAVNFCALERHALVYGAKDLAIMHGAQEDATSNATDLDDTSKDRRSPSLPQDNGSAPTQPSQFTGSLHQEGQYLLSLPHWCFRSMKS